MSGIATAVIGGAVIGGYMSSEAMEDAAGTAAQAEMEASDRSIEEQKRQFDKFQELLKPYVSSGTTALSQQQALLGLGGSDVQEEAIRRLEQSPQFGALVNQGEEAILQNASATGGLRGGNTQAALAQFRPSMLAQLIESQYQKLGNLSSLGQSSAAGVGNAGLSTANNVQAALTNSGMAQAQAALTTGTAKAQMWGDVAGSLGTVAGMSDKTFGNF